jgi:hypothetical protein
MFSQNLHKDVVDGDMDQLDDEANDAHDQESHGNSLSDLHELWLQGHKTYTAVNTYDEAGVPKEISA